MSDMPCGIVGFPPPNFVAPLLLQSLIYKTS